MHSVNLISKGLLALLIAGAAPAVWAQGLPKPKPKLQAPTVPDSPVFRKRQPIDKPVELLKCKPSAKKEETAAREAAEDANLSDHEVLSRLILAESLSTGFWMKKCKAPGDEALMEAIGWGVMNRVQRYSPKKDDPKPDAYFHVVFAQKQFSTSFSGAQDNVFARTFLCPLVAQEYLDKAEPQVFAVDLWVKAKEVASRIMDTYQKSGIPPNYQKITHFFYPYSEFFGEVRPAWAKDPDPAKNAGYMPVMNVEKPCAEFYRR